MAVAADPVKIRLLDREFLVACAADERAGLIAAADLMDSRMRELRNASGNAGFDRTLVLVALRMTHELLGLKADQQQHRQQLGASIETLTQKLEQALADAAGKSGRS